MRKPYPKPTRPMEYIAVFIMDVPVNEGTAYVFMAYDPFTDYLMNLAVEMTCDIETMLKALFYLTEQSLFQEHNNGPFHVLMDSFLNEKERIDNMLKLSGGSLLLNPSYHLKLMQQVAKNLEDFHQQQSEEGN